MKLTRFRDKVLLDLSKLLDSRLLRHVPGVLVVGVGFEPLGY